MDFDPNILIRNLNEALIFLNFDGYIKYCNPAALEVSGYTEDGLLGIHISKFYGDDQTKARYELDQAIKTGGFSSEGWRSKKDGSIYWGLINIRPVYEEDTLAGFALSLRDVSSSKQEVLALKDEAERYRLMVEQVQDYAIFLIDPHGYIITWNEGGERIKGYSSEEIIGRHFSLFYTKEDLDGHKPERELKIAAEMGKYEEAGWRVKKNGSLFWAKVVITALYDERNQLIGYSKVTSDLTAQREAEEIIRQSEERYRLLVEQVRDYAIFMLDEKGRVTSWNEGAKKLKGYTTEEILGKHFSVFFTEEDVLQNKPALKLQAARRNGKYEEEGWRVRKDGSRFWANILITAVYNAEGMLVGFSKVTRDLTERKEAEKVLRESYERYRHLADQLKATNDELSDANQELEQFASVASHDLQEPLRTVLSFMHLIDKKLEEGSADLRPFVGKSITAASRMRELIQKLLQYSHINRGETVREVIHVNELIEQALQNLKNAIDTSSSNISVDSEVEWIEGDRFQLVQLIQNLLSNAIKFTNQDNPSIRISCRRENDYVRFGVSDNGIGIEQEKLDEVFEIFKRLNPKARFPGSGIGLAICKKIVERHEGQIWAESEKNKGTTFYFTIKQPLVEQPVT